MRLHRPRQLRKIVERNTVKDEPFQELREPMGRVPNAASLRIR